MGLAGAQPTVVVTDGETRAALAVTRSLGRRGHAVHVTAARSRSLAAASRYASAEHVVADGALDPDGFAAEIEALTARVGASVVVPLTEVSMGSLFAAGSAERLPLAGPSREAYELAVDKHQLLARAAELGLDVPRGRLVEGDERERPDVRDLGLPLIVKSRRSRFLVDGRWRSGEVVRVEDHDELELALASASMAGGALVQEFVPGHGEAVFLLCEDGRPIAEFAHRRLREKPPSGGVSVLRESIEPDPALLRESRLLLSDLDWNGVAMVEFRRAPDGRAVLMEINPRFWGSLQLAVDAGVDFPALAVDAVLGRPIPPVSARIGVKTRWLLGDLDHLLICLRRSAMRRQVGRSIAGLLRDFLASFGDGSHLEILQRDDPWPFLRDLRDWWSETVGG